ncbi:MAG: ferritin-like domain-containing protein [Nannocystaceae bacterium]|nr:ferritin-like domain-containing protein [Myxococcales bacterium]
MLEDRAPIPYELFSGERTAREAARARRMESIYHRGQDRIWDGRAVLHELLERHGGPQVADDKREALIYVLSIILWGEYAAWRVASELADRLEELEPRLAATSQSHDEARHFYVLHDYLEALGARAIRPDAWGRRVIELTLRTDNITTKLLGMQLTIESIALSLFKALRDCGVDPVLAELMPYYERDEARHVGLGHQLLPSAFRAEDLRGRATWQFRHLWLAIVALGELKELSPHLETLGIEPRSILIHARDRMLHNLRELETAGDPKRKVDVLGGFVELLVESFFPLRAAGPGLLGRARGFLAAFHEGAIERTEQRIKQHNVPDYQD